MAFLVFLSGHNLNPRVVFARCHYSAGFLKHSAFARLSVSLKSLTECHCDGFCRGSIRNERQLRFMLCIQEQSGEAELYKYSSLIFKMGLPDACLLFRSAVSPCGRSLSYSHFCVLFRGLIQDAFVILPIVPSGPLSRSIVACQQKCSLWCRFWSDLQRQ